MSINLEYSQINEFEQLGAKAYIEKALTERHDVVACHRAILNIRAGDYDVGVEDYVALHEYLDDNSKGLKMRSTLCELSDAALVENHSNEHSPKNNTIGVRGLYLGFSLNDLLPDLSERTEVICIIPDGGESRAFYDKKTPIQRKYFTYTHARRLARKEWPTTRFIFAMVKENINDTNSSYTIDQFVDMKGTRPVPVEPSLQSQI